MDNMFNFDPEPAPWNDYKGYEEPRYYNVDGESIDYEAWACLDKLPEYRNVRYYDGWYVTINTQWLGFHGPCEPPTDGRPKIFQTTIEIFGSDWPIFHYHADVTAAIEFFEGKRTLYLMREDT